MGARATRRNEVVVIGAGAAGLAAAVAAEERGATVTVLEARDRLGGRVLTHHDATLPHPIELGAEFVHGGVPELWRVVEACGANVIEVADRHHVWHAGRLVPSDVRERLEHAFEADPDGRDRTVADYLASRTDLSDESRRLAERYVEGFHAADLRRMGLRGLIRAEEAAAATGDRQFRLLNGYDVVIAALAAKLSRPVQLRTVASRIDWRPGSVRVDTRTPDGDAGPAVDAGCAIVTVPLAVLTSDEATAPRFEPAVGSLERAASKIETGSVVRLVCHFDADVAARLAAAAGERAISEVTFVHGPDESFPIWWTAAPRATPVLTAWIGGPRARRLGAAGESEIVTRALASLAQLLDESPARLESRLERAYRHDWDSDPFARGAYSYVGVDGWREQRALADPVEDTLYFAGEAVAYDGHIGTVHGALLSGIRAGRAASV